MIAGYTKPAGSRQYFGALLLGAYDEGDFAYVGKVGTGFDQETLAALYREISTIREIKIGLLDDPPREKGVQFFSLPAHCPNFVPGVDRGQRSCVSRSFWDCVTTNVRRKFSYRSPPMKQVMRARPAQTSAMKLPITISHPDKVFWPDEGYTKRDLIEYYRSIFPLLAPYVKDRMLSLERCPDGMLGECFYQKQKPMGMPPGTPTKRIEHEGRSAKITDYVVGGSLQTQLALANLGCIAVHVMATPGEFIPPAGLGVH